MTYSNLIKTGLGVGLLAVSLGADATAIDGKHGFGSASIYVRSSATGTNYTSFIPSGNQSSDSVIVVEHMQGAAATSPQTWTYMVPVVAFSGLSGASASAYIPTGSLIGSIFSPSSTSWAVQSGSHTATSTVSATGFRFDSQGMGFVASASIATQLSSSYTNMLWDLPTPIAYPFSYSVSVSSSQCNVTAIAVIDNNDYLQWGGIVVNAVGYRSASSPGGAVNITTSTNGGAMALASDNVSVVWQAGSTSATGTVGNSHSSVKFTTYTATNSMSTFGSAAWNAMQTATSASISFPTNATIIMPVGTGNTVSGVTFTLAFNPASTAAAMSWASGTSGGQALTSPAQNATFPVGYFTMAGSQYKAAAGCGNAYTARAALNSTNLLIGGRNGLMRLW